MKKIKHNNIEESCIMCHLEIFEGADSSRTCPNGHYFHFDCLKDWIQYFYICPLCGETYSDRIILQSDKSLSTRIKHSRLRWIKCPDCKRNLKKEDFFNHHCQIIPKLLKEEKQEEQPRLSDDDFKILDFESEKGLEFVKKFEEEIGEFAIHEGKETPKFEKWLKGEKVEPLYSRILRERRKHLSGRLNFLKEYVKDIELIVTSDDPQMVFSWTESLYFSYERIVKKFKDLIERMKKWEGYDQERYPYSDMLNLIDWYDKYWKDFLITIRKLRTRGDDRYPYSYVFKPPEPPDDLSLAGRAQLRQPPKKKDTEEKIPCQYCGRELTKEEQLTHSCKKKPKTL